MKHLFSNKAFIFSTFFVLAVFLSNKMSADTKPNILLILADDLGYHDVGFNGATDIPTPALDKLANEGCIFNSAYVAHPFCGPSRAALMTGLYAHKIGAQFNLEGYSPKGVTTDEPFMSTVLKSAGYYTGLIGKWHLGEAAQYHPNARGFDDFYGFLGGGHLYFPDDYMARYANAVAKGNKKPWDYMLPMEHNGGPANETEYLTDGFSREGVRFINDAKQLGKPFFLLMAYNAPHTMLQAKQEDVDYLVNDKGIKYTDDKRKTYAAMVYALDRGVKKMVEALKSTGQYDNTLIVFLSDNGGRTDQGALNTPLRAAKGSTYEGGWRVPMFFHWPGKIAVGETMDYPVSALDFYPTFTKLAGAVLPKGKALDGKDIMGHVIAGTNPRAGEPIFAMRHNAATNEVGVRCDDWKLYSSGNGVWRLFDIKNDIHEDKNVASRNPDIVKTMKKDAWEWAKSHVEPQFFNTKTAEENWKNNNMPNWDKTFGTLTPIDDVYRKAGQKACLIYPNPNMGDFSIELNGISGDGLRVQLFDFNGRLVQSKNNIPRVDDYSYYVQLRGSVPTGVYLVQVTNNKRSFSQRLVVQ